MKMKWLLLLRYLYSITAALPKQIKHSYLYTLKEMEEKICFEHLAATDTIYQDLTFYNLKDFSEANKKRFGVAMDLGDEGRKQIKGNSLDYYLSTLKEVRENPSLNLKKEMTNGLQKWPHLSLAENQPTIIENGFMCEYEANYRGQITLVKKRLPGADAGKE
jgi:hypothetical protein